MIGAGIIIYFTFVLKLVITHRNVKLSCYGIRINIDGPERIKRAPVFIVKSLRVGSRTIDSDVMPYEREILNTINSSFFDDILDFVDLKLSAYFSVCCIASTECPYTNGINAWRLIIGNIDEDFRQGRSDRITIPPKHPIISMRTLYFRPNNHNDSFVSLAHRVSRNGSKCRVEFLTYSRFKDTGRRLDRESAGRANISIKD